MSIDCVIPAAGASERMGRWKLLLPFGSSTVVETTVARALEASGLDIRVILVAGYRGEELVDLFSGEARVEVLLHPEWHRGMLGSIQRALPFLRSDRFFTIPADMPLVPSAVYERLDLEWRASSPSPSKASFFATSDGELGHPVLIGADLVPGILGLDPGARLRPFLLEQGRRFIDCGSEAVLVDLDTDSDYAKHRSPS